MCVFWACVRAEFDTIETDPSFIADLEGAEGVTIYQGGLLLEPLHIGFNLTIPEGALPDGDTIPTDFFLIRGCVRRSTMPSTTRPSERPLAGYGAFNPHYLPIGLFGHNDSLPATTSRTWQRPRNCSVQRAIGTTGSRFR